MSAEPTPSGTQTPPATPPASTPPPAGGQGEDVTGLKSALATEREARKAAEKTAKELATWKQEQEDKGKSETERLTAESTRAKEAATKAEQDAAAVLTRANERVLRAEVKLLAQAAGFVDPDDAWLLMDRSAVKLDEGGNVTGADAAIKALAEKKPHLLGQGGGTPPPSFGAPAANRQGSGPAGNEQVRKIHEQQAAKSGRYIPF